jgi:hypothetical protein
MTLLDDEQHMVAGKRGATRLGFALLLKFYRLHGRFPRGKSELLAQTGRDQSMRTGSGGMLIGT